MTTLRNFVRRELNSRLSVPDNASADDLWKRQLARDVCALIDVFCEQGHSGGSAITAVEMFRKLALYEPLSPLTGADDEWDDISEEMGCPTWQNLRCHSVFKRRDGVVEDLHFYAFAQPNGVTFRCSESSKRISFPYTKRNEEIVQLLHADEEPAEALKRHEALKASPKLSDAEVRKLQAEHAEMRCVLAFLGASLDEEMSRSEVDFNNPETPAVAKTLVQLAWRLVDEDRAKTSGGAT